MKSVKYKPFFQGFVCYSTSFFFHFFLSRCGCFFLIIWGFFCFVVVVVYFFLGGLGVVYMCLVLCRVCSFFFFFFLSIWESRRLGAEMEKESIFGCEVFKIKLKTF